MERERRFKNIERAYLWYELKAVRMCLVVAYNAVTPKILA